MRGHRVNPTPNADILSGKGLGVDVQDKPLTRMPQPHYNLSFDIIPGPMSLGPGTFVSRLGLVLCRSLG